MADERYDPELWIAVAGPLRLYLLGKAHTFHGHMRTWDPDADQVLYVSKTEIVSASPAARHWIDGFIAGSEPSLSECLLITPAEADLLDEDEPLVREWQGALAQYARTGELPPEYWARYMQPGGRPRVTFADAD